MPQADIVVLLVPLSAATERMIGADQLGAMKPGGPLLTPHMAGDTPRRYRRSW